MPQPKVIAMYYFVATQCDKLSLHKGAYVYLIYEGVDTWWRCQYPNNGTIGWIPSNSVMGLPPSGMLGDENQPDKERPQITRKVDQVCDETFLQFHLQLFCLLHFGYLTGLCKMSVESKCPFDYLLILDFETTSDGTMNDYPFEVIQFSVVAFDVKKNKTRDDLNFNEYVKPVINPVLSDHCAAFTGIDQKTLDSADNFKDVYYRFVKWLSDNGIEERRFAIVCDSRQDMWRIAQYQLRLDDIIMPSFFRQYISLWRVFEAEQERRGRKELFEKSYISKMIEYYELDKIGKAHNSNDDCKTMCLIVQKMLETGATLTINEMLICSAVWRKKPLEVPEGWRTNFQDATKVFERIMPLVVKVVRPGEYRPEEYGICKYCKSKASVCGKTHRQYPAYIYYRESQPVQYAIHARWIKN
ncbi:unnamed protein product [Caenorhabditis sp. 36 PRJEB53466]|nr:unnamed protein product [Caenorhabditis sp. 36 PRJEB53466]